MIELADDDDTFLSLAEAAEAMAAGGRSKRQKLTSSSARAASASPLPAVEEGSYITALRGSHSTLWEQQLKLGQKDAVGGPRVGHNRSAQIPSSIGGGGACFKCGMTGHWARDCISASGREWGSGSGSEGASMASGDGGVPEKACPCGSGTCVVRTSNTAKNPGRKFYRCPLKEDNGGCSFFEWCDDPSPSLHYSRSFMNDTTSLSVPGIECPCGAGSCLVLVSRTDKNMGRQFYRCPLNEGNGSCGFFKWCNDQGSTNIEHALIPKDRGNNGNPSNHLSGERNNSSCFKCGQEGHWSRDCPMGSSDTNVEATGKYLGSTASGTCFKCSKSGHWARDCPANNLAAASATIKRTRS